VFTGRIEMGAVKAARHAGHPHPQPHPPKDSNAPKV